MTRGILLSHLCDAFGVKTNNQLLDEMQKVGAVSVLPEQISDVPDSDLVKAWNRKQSES